MVTRRLIPALLAAAAFGCASEESNPDADSSAEADASADQDAAADADEDVAVDADEDLVPDADEDATPDADADEDTTADAHEDVAPEADADADAAADADAEADADADVPPDTSDPCLPNPCTVPPTGLCDLDGITLHGSDPTGACSPDGAGGFTCDYSPADLDCSDDGRICVSGGVCSFPLQALRDAADGALSPPRQVRDLFVTYVKPTAASDNGFYAQESPTGPGLFFWTAAAAPAVAAGNTVSVTIAQLGQYHGLKEARAFAVDENDGLTPSVGPWAQDLSAGAPINESTESELVRILDAQLDGGAGDTWTASYGTGGATTVAYAGFAALVPPPCFGMVLDLLAPAGEYDGTYELTPFRDGDFSGLDASACPADDDSNWHFEDWGASVDPPDDFLKTPTTLFTATRSTTVVQDGAAACALTWTTTANRDLVQTWYSPVAVGVVYTHHVWLYDNDPAGRARTGLQFYDAAGAAIGTPDYATPYTSDAPAWAEFTFTETAAPAGAASIRALLRLYDVGAGFTTATVYADDWAITSPLAFLTSNGVLDSWTATAPAAPRRFYDTLTPTMDVWAALNDAGVLYVATDEVHVGWSDHILYVWVGAPAASATVAAPWAKSGTVAGVGADPGSALFALVQEEATGYVEVVRWSGSAWLALTSPTATAGFDGVNDGTGVVEATVNLVAALALAAPNLVPGTLAFAVAPYGTSDGGALDSANQFPRPTTRIDGNVDPGEVLALRRSSILVGNVQ
ncbi:MAG: hypothetical protein HY905_02015 [Deltaproteobacteria bacterium]|nr:hypothetical protein [Deltaproteobacteria bacterium]